jgi:hypothetical protein
MTKKDFNWEFKITTVFLFFTFYNVIKDTILYSVIYKMPSVVFLEIIVTTLLTTLSTIYILTIIK